jgi:hypothetical protein
MIRLFTALACCCAIFLMSCSARPSTEVAVQSQSNLEGITLYQQYCANCHRPFSKTTKPHTNASRLRSAIRFFPAMSNLDFLTAEQIDAVASALATIDLQQVTKKH